MTFERLFMFINKPLRLVSGIDRILFLLFCAIYVYLINSRFFSTLSNSTNITKICKIYFKYFVYNANLLFVLLFPFRNKIITQSNSSHI